MNFQEVTALAVDITGRPDKVVQIRAAVNATISRLIMKNNFVNDVIDTTVNIDSTVYTGEVSLTQFTRFKSVKYVRPNTIKKCLDPVSMEKVFSNNAVRKDVFYVAGTNLVWVVGIVAQTLEIGYYTYAPRLDNTSNTHWLLDIVPDAIAELAASKIFKSVGDDNSAAAYATSGFTAFQEATAHLLDRVAPVSA